MDVLDINFLQQVRQYTQSSSSFANDYIFFHARTARIRRSLPKVFRIEGMAIFLCTKGRAKAKINFRDVDIEPGTLLTLDSHFLIEPIVQRGGGIECYLIFMSKEFVNAFQFDSTAYPGIQNRSDASPVFNLNPERLTTIGHYFGMLSYNAKISSGENLYNLQIARSLIGALIYQLLEYDYFDSLEKEDTDAALNFAKGSFRKVNYVTDFMRLVRLNYKKERTAQFYSQQLFITPKYLSAIIKEVTGRSATEWIDNHVIVEAKKLLKFSDKDIQQISDELNFPTQSEFARYFKRLTSMSPTKFRSYQ